MKIIVCSFVYYTFLLFFLCGRTYNFIARLCISAQITFGFPRNLYTVFISIVVLYAVTLSYDLRLKNFLANIFNRYFVWFCGCTFSMMQNL